METFKIKKNFANKLNCDTFVHIARQPEDGYTEHIDRPYLIEAEGMPIFPATLVDFVRFDRAENLPKVFTLLSHGLDTDQYAEFLPDYNPSQPVAVYIFKKVQRSPTQNV